jgi:hypothetical protein
MIPEISQPPLFTRRAAFWEAVDWGQAEANHAAAQTG